MSNVMVQRGTGKVKMHGKNSMVIKTKDKDSIQVIPRFKDVREKMASDKGLQSDIVGFGLVLLGMLTTKCTDVPGVIYDANSYLDRDIR